MWFIWTNISNKSNFFIRCTLNENINSNIEGQFYLTKKHIEKSFEVNFKESKLHFSLEIIEEFI